MIETTFQKKQQKTNHNKKNFKLGCGYIPFLLVKEMLLGRNNGFRQKP